MALIKCKECGKDVSTEAESCPNCGAVLKKKKGNTNYVLTGILILIVLVVIGTLINKNTTKPEAGFKIPAIGNQIITFDEYQQIQNGMSYRGVVQIIGNEGEELSRNTIDGVPGVMESVETIMYQWVNNNGSNMNAIFQNDKLMQKAQFGLK